MRRDREPRGLTGETGVVIVSVGSALGDSAGSAMRMLSALQSASMPHEARAFCAGYERCRKVTIHNGKFDRKRHAILHPPNEFVTVTALNVYSGVKWRAGDPGGENSAMKKLEGTHSISEPQRPHTDNGGGAVEQYQECADPKAA